MSLVGVVAVSRVQLGLEVSATFRHERHIAKEHREPGAVAAPIRARIDVEVLNLQASKASH